MKIYQAFLTNLGLMACQGALGTMFFENKGALGIFGNTFVQIGAQAGLTALQYYSAKRNSESDPKGKKLVEVNTSANGPIYQTAIAEGTR